MDRLIYLDHASTSPMRPEVVEAMEPFFFQRFGNPSGSHRVARDARQALEEARDEIAELLGCKPGEVVFTSGGTESDNLAVLGSLAAQSEKAARSGQDDAVVVCSAVEHAAVLNACLESRAELRLAPVDSDGTVDLEALEELLGPDGLLVSVMLANNEVGTIQPIEEVATLVRQLAPRAVLHTDAVQAASFLDVASMTACTDLVSVSAHKLGGPRGTGVLIVRDGVGLHPLLHGGGQERERRSGTHDVAGAVGMAVALRVTATSRVDEEARVRALRDRLSDGILAAVPGSRESAPREKVLAGHCHLRFEGIEQEELLVVLDELGVCASAGSACASGAIEPSHVLIAMGVSAPEAKTALRLTLGHTTTDQDVQSTVSAVAEAVSRLRA